MTTRIATFIKITLSVMCGVLLGLSLAIFIPSSYDVPVFTRKHSVKHWNLPTGSKIAYTYLPATGPEKYPYPVIYLHGGPGAGITSLEIDAYRMLSKQGFDVYLYDQVGCGNSSRLYDISQYTAQRHLFDLESIHKILKAEKIVLAAQSWGSILALSYLAAHPQAVDRLIITAPAPVQPANKSLESLRPPDSLNFSPPTYINKRILKKGSLRERATYYLARNYSIKLTRDSEADACAAYYANELNKLMVCEIGNSVRSEGTEGLYANYMTAKSIASIPDQRKKLAALQTPVLVFKAQCDNQPWGYTSEYLSLFDNSSLHYLRNAGHNAFIERPEEYVDAINSFLKDSSLRP